MISLATKGILSDGIGLATKGIIGDFSFSIVTPVVTISGSAGGGGLSYRKTIERNKKRKNIHIHIKLKDGRRIDDVMEVMDFKLNVDNISLNELNKFLIDVIVKNIKVR